MTNLLESWEISPSPPPGGEAQISFPLTFFDIPWLHFHPIRRLIFYDYPCSKAYFLETLVPKLKQSLSLTLKHYTPLAGKLLYPLITGKPKFRYVVGDSVSLTIFESSNDFDKLVGNLLRDADQFYEYVPQLPPIRDEPDYKLVSLIAIQVTLFPEKGICIGFSNHHTIGDASSIVGFIKAWASIKDLVLRERPDLVYLSSFVVTSSYVWKNLVKSGDMIGEEIDDNIDEYFIFPVDARARINPRVPANYFGNCLAFGMAKIRHGELVGNEGFVLAAEDIAGDIRSRVNNKEEVLKGAENWMSDMKKFAGINVVGVSGSPKFDLYSADFGWGMARKLEAVSIDGDYSMSLCKLRDSDGGIEVGLSLPKTRMETFAALFADGLR